MTNNPFIPITGKLTRFGYSGDSLGDSASAGTGKSQHPTGCWDNQLIDTDIALSPDMERALKSAGLKPHGAVELQLENGTEITRTWGDRTMQDKQAIAKFGKPLTGRFDLFCRYGQDRDKDGVKVVGFRLI